jgi:hypothetical protein
VALSKSRYPVHQPEKFYRQFPQLDDTNHTPTSQATPQPDPVTKPYYIYNCFAFIVGDKKKFWWPDGPYSYWPRKNAPDTVEALMTVLAEDYGYEKCSDGEDGRFEKGVQKVAIFVKGGVPVHVAFQPFARDGIWLSKMGYNIDMEHRLRVIETRPDDDPNTQGYGIAKHFMRLERRRSRQWREPLEPIKADFRRPKSD